MKERILTVTEASRGFSDLINRVRYRGESATVTKNGKAIARIVPIHPKPITFEEFVKRWKPGSHLTLKEADAFLRDLEKGRKFFKPYVSPWD